MKKKSSVFKVLTLLLGIFSSIKAPYGSETILKFCRQNVKTLACASAVTAAGSTAAYTLYSKDNAEKFSNYLNNQTPRIHELSIDYIGKRNGFPYTKKESEEDFEEMYARELVETLCKLCNLQIHVENLEAVPKDGKVVVIGNHDNFLAGYLLAAIIDEVRKENSSRVVSMSNLSTGKVKMHIVDEKGRLSEDGQEIIKRHLDGGNPLIIFPKTWGFISKRQDESLPQFRFMDGFLRFAIDNEAPILPVGIRLEYPMWWKVLRNIVPYNLGASILSSFIFFKYYNTTVNIRFGNLVSADEVAEAKKDVYTKRGKDRYPEHVTEKYQKMIRSLSGSDD